MLFPRHQHDALRDGSVTVAFRRWKRASVRPGGTLRTPVGVLAIDEVTPIAAADVTDEDARRAGHEDREAALRAVDRYDGELFRIRFRLLGEDPRRTLASTPPTDAQLTAITAELARMDARSRHGPWTTRTLELINRYPETRAPELAERVGRETAPFKRDVRRLKELGLTVSHAVGYRLSPRGQAVLDRLRSER